MKNKREIFLKIPKSIWAIGLVIVMLLSVVSYGFAAYIDKIEVGDIADWYHTAVNFFPTITNLAEFKGRWIFLVLDILFAGLYIYRRFYREKVFLIRHQTMAYDLAEIKQEFKKKYQFEENILQQVNEVSSDSVQQNAIEDIDQMAIEAQKSSKQIAYYGIAHTPLIFRLGFKIGDQNNVILLHKKRSNEDLFEEWKKERSTIKILHNEENMDKNSNELIVAISTSFEVQKQHLDLLHPENKHILFFYTNNSDVDSVLSYEDAEYLRSNILFDIREFVKKYKIDKIHMVISSSVAFTFFLAQGYSPHHDPEIIVYHYIQGKYPWGVNMNKSVDEACVKNL